MRIIGEEASAPSHELRDALTRVAVPSWFYDHTSPAGKRVLAEVGLDGSRLPVVTFYDGRVLVHRGVADLWHLLG